MREELIDLSRAIETGSLPPDFDPLFGRLWDTKTLTFHAQETTLLEFKETYCDSYTDPYGVGIVRLALAFHNTYGGFIVFGVKDRVFTITGVSGPFEIERFNRAISDFTGSHFEAFTKVYLVPGTGKSLCVLLIPRRKLTRPVVLRQILGKYLPGTIWVRDRHEALEASFRHLPVLYSARTPQSNDARDLLPVPVHRSLPPSPSTVRGFIDRFELMRTLWDWLIFGDQPRMYLDGPGGSGKTTLAFEFARLLAESASEFRFANNEVLDYVVFISGKEIEFNTRVVSNRHSN